MEQVTGDNSEKVDAQQQSASHNARKRKRKVLLFSFTLFVLLISLIWIALYKYIFSLYEKTDDAYVTGNLVYITPKVAGTVINIHADNTDLVNEGDDLIRIDNTDFIISLDKRAAELGNTVRQLSQQYEKATQYDAIIAGKRVDLAKAQAEYERRKGLIHSRVISKEDFENARHSYESAQSSLESTLTEAKGTYALTAGVVLKQHPVLLQASTNYMEAWLNLQRATLRSPVSGYVAQRKAQVGMAVNAGTSLMAVVPLSEVWIEANFKETEISNIRIGQPVTIIADVYGSKVEYQGKVIGISAGTGSAFALLPPQNASGNWIKVVQRVPVKIALVKEELLKKPLLLGMSVLAKVSTEDRTGEVLSNTINREVIYTTTAFNEPMEQAEAAIAQIIEKNLSSPADNMALNTKNAPAH